MPELKLKGAFDIRPEALDKAREMGLYAYESLDEVLNDPEVDIVTIATPNNFHKPLAIKALRAGKENVISEKPVTLNAAELEEIIAVRDETGKLFSVHQNRRWDKDYAIIKKILCGWHDRHALLYREPRAGFTPRDARLAQLQGQRRAGMLLGLGRASARSAYEHDRFAGHIGGMRTYSACSRPELTTTSKS